MKSGFSFRKRRPSDTDGLIYVALYFKEMTEYISTGQRIAEKDWDRKLRNIYKREHLAKVRFKIGDIKSKVDNAELRLMARGEMVTPVTVKKEYGLDAAGRLNTQREKDAKTKQDKKSLTLVADQWLSDNLFQYQPTTQRAVKSSIAHFKRFLTKSGSARGTLADLNPELIKAYEKYLQDNLKLANSSHGRVIKHLKWFLKSVGYDVSKIKIRTHRRDKIWLTQEEITALENIDVSQSSEKQKAKDLFLLGCYTGLRISDIQRINDSMIIDGKICMTLKKNKTEVTIPVVAKTRAILDRYMGRSPRLAEQVLNRTIKDVCKEAGITKVITIRINKAGRDFDYPQPKYKFISSHIASKTFITLVGPEWYGLTPQEVAAIVGKDLRTLLNNYYQPPRESAIKKMSNAI